MRRRDFLHALVCSAAAWPLIARAQEPAEIHRVRPSQSMTRGRFAVSNRDQLADLFQQLERRYSTIKTLTAKYAPLKPHHPAAVKRARSILAVRMLAYEKLRAEIQGTLNSMKDMNELEFMAFQNNMQRASQIVETIEKIMKKMSETGDSIIQNIK